MTCNLSFADYMLNFKLKLINEGGMAYEESYELETYDVNSMWLF